jgi:hypothetical protein
MARTYRQGHFRPKNPQKYQGDPTDIVFRSSWEKIAFKMLDEHPSCISWSSETVVVPYVSPIDNAVHRYFVDLKATFKYPDGTKKTFLVEIKPNAQRFPPKNTRNQKRLVEETETYLVNQAKWEAATKFAKKYGYEFMVMDEYDLGIAKRN